MSQPATLQSVKLTGPFGEALIYTNGAHVASFVPKGQKEMFFMSSQSHLQPGKAIRGGVPIIFPWFGGRANHPESPAHGFARTLNWNVVQCEQRARGACALTLELNSDKATREVWPFDFSMRFTVCAEKTLSMTLTVTNTGGQEFTFEEALHTYLAVGDVRQAAITGLSGTTYIDKVDGFKRKLQGPEPIMLTGETDRVYLGTKSECEITDPVWGRKIYVAKENSEATVVWNPWIAKAKAMADFGDEEWPGMVCVETCNCADHAITLGAGKTHSMTAIVGLRN